jgi:hypothetical protein
MFSAIIVEDGRSGLRWKGQVVMLKQHYVVNYGDGSSMVQLMLANSHHRRPSAHSSQQIDSKSTSSP